MVRRAGAARIPARPLICAAAVGDFSDPTYLNRYGFIPDSNEPDSRRFRSASRMAARWSQSSGEPWLNPRTKKDMTGIGLTCAACHTGSFTYKDKAVIIDGGPALTDLFKLKQGFGVALLVHAISARPFRPVRRSRPGLGRVVRAKGRAECAARRGAEGQYKGINVSRTRSQQAAPMKDLAGWTRSTASATRCSRSTSTTPNNYAARIRPRCITRGSGTRPGSAGCNTTIHHAADGPQRRRSARGVGRTQPDR